MTRLAAAAARGRLPVRFAGTVVHSDPAWRLLFVSDSSGTTFVDPIGLPKLPSPGSRVQVEGETGFAGGFPGVVSARVVETGRGALPPGGSSFRNLDAAADRLAWVEIRGVVRALEATRGHSIVGVQVGGRRLEVLVAEELRSGPRDLLDAQVVVTGVLESDEGGWHAARLWVSSWSQLRVAEKPTPPGSLAPVSIEEALLLARSFNAHRVRLRGRLAESESADSLVLRDDSGAIEVRRYERSGITLGGLLDVVGFLELVAGKPRLVDVEEVNLTMPDSMGRPADASPSAAREPPISSLARVRALPVEEARRGRLVDVTAVVSAYDPFEYLLFVRDESGEAVVALFDADTEPFVDEVSGGRAPRPGQSVRLEARTAPGALAPILVNVRVRVLSEGAPLAWRPVSAARLATGQDDCRLVSVEGTLRRVETHARVPALVFESDGRRFRAPLAEAPPEGLGDRLVGARVRLRGVCVTRYDWRQRFSHVELLLPDLAAVQVVHPPVDPVPLRLIRDVLRPVPERPDAPRVRVRGEVLLQSRRGVFLRDESGSLDVDPVSFVPLHPGDRVEALGFAEPGLRSPRLADAELHVQGRGPEPAPVPLTVGQILGSSRSGELVQVAAQLIDGVRTSVGTTLLLESGEAVFEATLEDGGAGGPSLLPLPDPGSRVELTGVALTDAEAVRGASLLLVLRSFSDVVVLHGPPWWTPLRARTIAGTLLATVAIALLWGMALRRRVRQQTAQIEAQLGEIRESEERHRTVFDVESDAMTLIDTQTLRLVEVNRAATTLYGYDRDEMLRRTAADLSAEPEQTASAISAGGEVVRIPLRYHRKKDGTVFPVEIAARFFTLRGRPILLAAIRDVTERQQAQEAREGLIADLEAKNAELERFTYTVSHDLRSPLVTVKGFLGFIERDAAAGNTARLRGDLDRISNAIDKMDALLRDVLELSRIGRLANPPEAVPFAQIVAEARELVRGRLESRGIVVETAPDLPVVFGDRARLVEVVQNLLDNAARFAGGEAGPRIEVGPRGIDEDGRAVLYVRDNGIGIEPRHHERVFGLFEKLDPASEGTGVGLALAKRIVGVHGGRIWVESEGRGRGATFCLALPRPPEAQAGNPSPSS